MANTRKYQLIDTYYFDRDESKTLFTSKSSFKTLEKAIENAEMWINKTESWIDTTHTKLEIIDKETNKIVWGWVA